MISDRCVTILVHFDFSKAFNLVDHAILLDKLKKLGLSESALNLMKSYLRGRTQAVRDKYGNFSTWRDLDTGVPQGSVLGPLLFSIFINSLTDVLKYCRFLLYADDLQIYLHGPTREIYALLDKVEHDIRAVHEWTTLHNLFFNPNKTKIMIIGSPYQVGIANENSLPQISISGTLIPYVTTAKNLGVILDSNLNGTRQVLQT